VYDYQFKTKMFHVEQSIKDELISKIGASKTAIVFIFNEDQTSQTYAHGNPNEMIVTILDEMKKSSMVNLVIRAVYSLQQKMDEERQQ
jgi:hypothetical protein